MNRIIFTTKDWKKLNRHDCDPIPMRNFHGYHKNSNRFEYPTHEREVRHNGTEKGRARTEIWREAIHNARQEVDLARASSTCT